MTSTNKGTDYKQIINNDESLKLFLATVREFDQSFCDHMANGDDFTLSFEVRGCNGEVIHCRMKDDGFKRPDKINRDDEWRQRGMSRKNQEIGEIGI